MTRVFAILAGLILVTVLGVTAYFIWFTGPQDAFADCRDTRVAGGQGALGGPFTLVDETGATVTDKDVFTKPTLLYFGYTFCPDVCPLDSARNADAVALLRERGYDAQTAFISIDPKRDTVDEVAAYTNLFDDEMIGLTGTPEQVAVASRAYRTYYNAHDEEDDEFYLVDHSTFSYFVMPDTGFQTFFRRDHTPDQIAEIAACFIDKS